MQHVKKAEPAHFGRFLHLQILHKLKKSRCKHMVNQQHIQKLRAEVRMVMINRGLSWIVLALFKAMMPKKCPILYVEALMLPILLVHTSLRKENIVCLIIRGQAAGSSVKTNKLSAKFVRPDDLPEQFVLTDDPSACLRLYTNKLSYELSFYIVPLDSLSCVFILRWTEKTDHLTLV